MHSLPWATTVTTTQTVVSGAPEVLELPACLDSSAGLDLANDIRQQIKQGLRNLVLDCSAVTIMTAAGLRSILVAAREMQAQKGKLVVCNIQDDAKRMFEACGFDAFIATYSQREEAVATLAA
jgi:anti-sigma B factor antagonist